MRRLAIVALLAITPTAKIFKGVGYFSGANHRVATPPTVATVNEVLLLILMRGIDRMQQAHVGFMVP